MKLIYTDTDKKLKRKYGWLSWLVNQDQIIKLENHCSNNHWRRGQLTDTKTEPKYLRGLNASSLTDIYLLVVTKGKTNFQWTIWQMLLRLRWSIINFNNTNNPWYTACPYYLCGALLKTACFSIKNNKTDMLTLGSIPQINKHIVNEKHI